MNVSSLVIVLSFDFFVRQNWFYTIRNKAKFTCPSSRSSHHYLSTDYPPFITRTSHVTLKTNLHQYNLQSWTKSNFSLVFKYSVVSIKWALTIFHPACCFSCYRFKKKIHPARCFSCNIFFFCNPARLIELLT